VLTERYLASVANLPGIMGKIVEGTAPERFSREHLATIGFGGSNDRAVIPLLKVLGFLSSDGVPTDRYHRYRDESQSAKVLGEALLESYSDLFTINENPTEKDRAAIEGKFKSTHNTTDIVAKRQAMTFFALLKLADLEAARSKQKPPPKEVPEDKPVPERQEKRLPVAPSSKVDLRYNIEVHLPPTKDIEVYNAIFRAVREHLLVD